jgi:hypothetical protein
MLMVPRMKDLARGTFSVSAPNKILLHHSQAFNQPEAYSARGNTNPKGMRKP